MSDTRYVFDASALLAILSSEPGAEVVYALLREARISAVNLSEVVAKVQERGIPDAELDRSIADLQLNVIPFDREQAVLAGRLRLATRARGLSFGDRSCLALASVGRATAVTMDRSWTELELPVPSCSPAPDYFPSSFNSVL